MQGCTINSYELKELFKGVNMLYEFKCDNCDTSHEFIMKLDDPLKTICPECKEPKLNRVISKCSFNLKGDGYYKAGFH